MAAPVLSEGEFVLFQSLIHEVAGIWLADVKRALVAGRLGRRVRELQLDSFQAYHALCGRDAQEMVRMLDAITTNETHFFREKAQFELIADELVPRWLAEADAGTRARRLNIWSAACSSGEEPYSIAMLLRDRLGAQWQVDVHATDLSTRMLARARAAVWPTDRTHAIPGDYLKRYALRGTGPEEGRIRIGADVRGMVRFRRLNLKGETYDVPGPFDAVFCRNVLIYFDAAGRRRVLDRLLSHIGPGGYLFLGHAESLMGMSDRAKSVRPAVYQVPRA